MNEPSYLNKLPAWNPESAKIIASEEKVQLDEKHLEILEVARQFYDHFGFSPSMRPLCKYVAEHLDLNKGRSIYLLQLFPGSPAKKIAKIAGLPAPKNCL